MRFKILYDNSPLSRDSTPTPFDIFCSYMVNVNFPGKIIITVDAQKLCVSGKRNYIAVNYYRIFININTFLSSVE